MPLESIAETVAEQIRRQEFVEVFAHHDADGIADRLDPLPCDGAGGYPVPLKDPAGGQSC